MNQASLRAAQLAESAPNAAQTAIRSISCPSTISSAVSSDTACADTGTLLLDSKGIIRFCSASAARIVAASPHQLVGRQIRTVLPGLPINPLTEGYNIAFAAFSAGTQKVRSWSVAGDTHRQSPVEGAIALLKIGGVYLFSLELRNARGTDCLPNLAHASSLSGMPASEKIVNFHTALKSGSLSPLPEYRANPVHDECAAHFSFAEKSAA